MPTEMPDIANYSDPTIQGSLDRVGMSHIEMPFTFILDETQQSQVIDTEIQAYVSLDDPTAKGIHMSRLFLQLDKLSTEGELSYASIKSLLEHFIVSHEGLSNTAFVQFDFKLNLRRESLLSKKVGWKSYPVSIHATLHNDRVEFELTVNVAYSSTCPCSAALARQLIQQAFDVQFSETQLLNKEQVLEWLGTTQGIVATPHSQRSVAEIKVKLSPEQDKLPFLTLINALEDSLQTPVQAAVKREDEQEFARLNGQNLMFCEDAARRIQQLLDSNTSINDFYIRVNHYESLHPHNAVSITTKGIEGGYSAN